MIEYLVDHSRVLAGGERPFDEAAVRELVRRDVERARNIAASENHGLVADGEVTRAVPVLDCRAHARDPRHRGSDVPA